MIQKQENRINIGLLTPPIGTHSLIPLSNLVNIVLTYSNSIYLITGNEGYCAFKNDSRIHVLGVNHYGKRNCFLRAMTFFLLQIRISITLIEVIKKCDIWIFFLGSENLILPMCVAKIFRKKVYLMFAGSSVHTLFYDPLVNWLKILTHINCTLSDQIIVYSNKLISEWDLGNWENKILLAHEHSIDCEKFSQVNQYCDRENIIGYIGRLSEEKGIWNFILAIDQILKERQDIKFIIIGDGLLREKIQDHLDRNELRSHVKMEGWVSHDNLPNYLNNIKLLILPSYTEGLPNIILEAMACGTPVLATPVGAVPDIIKDDETGFIIKNNSVGCIEKTVIRAMRSQNLKKISENARTFVKDNYSFNKTILPWKKLLNTQ